MRIACFPATEAQLRGIAEQLRKAGLFDQYEEEAHGESILISIKTRTFNERETVKAILQDVGVVEFLYEDESAA